MAAVYSNGGDIGRTSWDISIETLSPSSLRGRADDLSAVEPTTAPNKPAVKQTTAADNSERTWIACRKWSWRAAYFGGDTLDASTTRLG